MNQKLLSIAAGVIAKSDREHPADGVLRTELKNAKGLPRDAAGEISRAVFAYYRWFGSLDKAESMERQIGRAIELNDLFKKSPSSISDADLDRAIPSWLQEHMTVSPQWLRSLQIEPELWLRAKVGQGRGLAERLGECWVAGDGPLSDALRYEGMEDLFRTPEFHVGEFELQDISSQIVGLICDPKPSETWWDACAGEGGKALHLCDLMRGKGLLWASDRAEWRLKKLKQRAARAKAFNYRAVLWDGSRKLPTKTKFDGILIDAPCSGIGTWQRNPQARWTTSPDDVTELSAIQIDLLSNVVPALKPNGRLIYSVCTLANAETISVQENISKRFENLKPLMLANPFRSKETPTTNLFLRTEEMNGNGMFICGWMKNSSTES